MVITNKFRADVGIRDLIISEKPITTIVHYVKTDAGSPAAVGLANEKCLNIFNNTLYKYDGSSWVIIPISIGDRFCFAGTGFAATGCGNNIPNAWIYDFDGSIFITKIANDGVIVLVKHESLDYEANILITYDNDNTQWIKSSSSSSTSTVNNEDIDDRINSLLIAGEAINLTYNDAANTLTIDCELAESGNNTVNKGVSSFDNNYFNVSSGFVSLAYVDGGNF